MTVDWAHFTPQASLAGCLLVYLLAGTSLRADATRLLFLLGLLVAPWAWRLLAPLLVAAADVGPTGLVLAGLLVGFGVRLVNGCASGHGVCGLGRPSGRSLVNVPAFMGAGVATVFVLRHLLDAASSTHTHLLGDAGSGEALLIDPVDESVPRDLAVLRELGLRLLATLDTHGHADHVTAAWLLKQRCGNQILLLVHRGAANVDRPLRHGDQVYFGRLHLQGRARPGHTSGCLSFVLDDQSMAVTGDSVLIRGCGRTDFQQGNPATLYRSVKQQTLSLPASCLLYPGHDYCGLAVTRVAEEQRFNPRLGGAVDTADFAGYTDNLGLPHPKLMDPAVPAKLRCGQPDHAAALPAAPTWAPLTFTFSGQPRKHQPTAQGQPGRAPDCTA